MATVTATAAANRFGLGASPGELARVGSDPRGWLRSQLDARDNVGAFADMPDSAVYLARYYWKLRTKNGKQPDKVKPGMQAIDGIDAREFQRAIVQEQVVRQGVAVSSTNGFAERIVRFWSNHFAVSVDKHVVAQFAAPMEREAIRPHAFGRFADLLVAVERHPGMLLYLDNSKSIGAKSLAAEKANKRTRLNPRGLNENLARETLELHTLGVNGGYSQGDVIELARAITGWGVASQREVTELAGGTSFVFHAEAHEPGARRVLGKTYADDGEAQGRRILQDLSLHPATAHHLAFKLARHFVADVPSPALVERMASAYLASDGELMALYKTLINDDAAWQADVRKFKTPADFMVSAMRACGLSRRGDLMVSLDLLARMSQPMFLPRSPAGFADTAADWNGADALLKRVQAAQALAERVRTVGVIPLDLGELALGATLDTETATALRRAESVQQGIALLLASPAFQWRC